MPRRTRLPIPTATASVIQKRSKLRPTVGLVLGSGFAAFASILTVEREFPYRDLPGFPVGSAPGHEGRLLIGAFDGIPVAVLSGRAHYYEGFELAETTFPIRVLAASGVSTLVLTNAAGGINPRFKVGDFMALNDHINFMGTNPLRGPDWPGHTRFVDMTRAYDVELVNVLVAAAKRAKIKMHRGTYLALSGPSFETPSEIRMFANWGADAVGMSTVPETIVARQCGMKVAGISCITNPAAGLGGEGQTVTHTEVLELAHRREVYSTALLGEILRGLAKP